MKVSKTTPESGKPEEVTVATGNEGWWRGRDINSAGG